MKNSWYMRALDHFIASFGKMLNGDYEWREAAWIVPTILLGFCILLLLAIPISALLYFGKGLLWLGNKLLADEFTRLKGHCLQSPIVTYRHPKTGRHVVVYGMIHRGEEAYYTAIKNDLATRSDFHVLHEGPAVTKSTQKKLARAEREWWRAYWVKMEQLGRQLSTLGLRLQTQSLPRQPEWEPCDLPLKKFVRMSMKFDLDQTKESNFDINAALASLSTAECLAKLRQMLRPTAEHKAIITDRDRIVGDRIEQLISRTDVAVIYGAGHLPGIQKGLRRLGFRRASVQWLTVYRIKDTLEVLLCDPIAPLLATQLMAGLRDQHQ